MENIEFSVIVLVYNKAYEMDLVLTGFQCQDFDMGRVEFIVVDDGSVDGLREVLERHSAALRVRHFALPHTGNRGHNRNYGIREARGRRIIFLDGDQIPERDFLRRHAANTQEDALAVSMGCRRKMLDFERRFVTPDTVRDRFQIIREFPAVSDERTSAAKLMKGSGLKCRQAWNMVFSHNICLHRETLDKVGGFDKDFSANWGVEDVELGYRLHRAGARIVYDESLLCYHVNHPEKIEEKIRQLRLNLDLFLRKHPNWEAELYTYEHKIWPIKYLAVRDKIHSGAHLLADVKDVGSVRERLAGSKTLCIGITCEPIRRLAEAAVATSPSRDGEGEGGGADLNLIGTRLPYADGQFGTALVSMRYRELGTGLFELVLREAARVAARVALVSGDGWAGIWRDRPTVEEWDASGGATPPAIRHAVRPVILSATDMDLNCYGLNAMHHLGAALGRMGYSVELRHSFDPFGEKDPFGHFFSLSDREARRFLVESTANNLGFLDESAPNVLDSALPMHAGRSLGKKVLWREPQYENYEGIFEEMERGNADRVLIRKAAPAGGPGLSLGIDVAALERSARHAPPARGTRFLIACKSLSPAYFLEESLEAFLEAVKDRPDCSLEIVAGIPRSPLRSPYINDAMFRYIQERFDYAEFKSARIRRNLKEIAGPDTRVSLVEGNLEEDILLAKLRGAHCLIDLNPTGETNPLVLYSLAMGRKPAVFDPAGYAGYAPADDFIRLGCGRVPAAAEGPGIRAPQRMAKDFDHYYLLKKADPGALGAFLDSAMADPSILKASAAAKAAMTAEFSWDAVARRFEGTVS